MVRFLHRALVNHSLRRVSVQLAAMRDYLADIEEDYAQLGFSCDSILGEILEAREQVKALAEERDYLVGRLAELS